MWIISKHGFCSVVQDFTSSELLHLRGRVAGDLERMLAVAGVSAEVLTTPDADYRYRAAISRADFLRLMVVLGESVDYPNFKGEVATHPAQAERLQAYHEVWHTLRGLQQ